MTRPFSRRLSALVLLVTAAAVAEPVSVKLDLSPGDSFRQTMRTEQQIDQTVMGQQMTMDQVNAITYTSEVLDRPSDKAGGVWVQTVYDRVVFEQAGPTGAVKYDSAAPEQGELPMQLKPFGAMVGSKVRFEITPDGEIHGVEGFEEMIKRMVDAMDLPEGEVRDVTMQTMKQSFNDESMRQMLGMSMGIYPKGEVAVGDTWDAKQELGVPFPMRIDTTYRLESVQPGTVTVATDGQVKPGQGEGMKVGNGGEMKVKLDGTQGGTTTLDRATGWATAVDLTQDMEGEMTMTPPAGQGQSMTIPMKIKGTITIRPAGEAGGSGGPAATQPAKAN